MYHIALKTVLIIFSVLLIGGCSTKSEQEYEKPALYWYQKMMRSVAAGNLEKADDYFTSLESEHVGSPLIPEAMLILVQAHMDGEEYLLANFYLDEYLKRYGTSKNRDFVEFMKIKASFFGLKSPQRNQELIEQTLQKAKRYIRNFPESEFRPMVETIEVRLEMTRYLMNEKIASLYERRDKPKAARIYRDRNAASWIEKENMVPPSKSWLGRLFE
ncbi:putative lipoprotein [Hydrogenimonas sp.]|nr:putative lipoprotein [Hydrogenimonas sp.]